MRKHFFVSLRVSATVALVTVALSLGTYSCVNRASRPQPVNPLQQAQDITYPDTSRRAQLLLPPPTFLQRLFRPRAPTLQDVPASQFTGKLKLGKGAQLTIINSTGDNNTIAPKQASIGKNKAVAQLASDASTVDAAQLKGNGQLTQVHGNDNDVKPTLEQAKETHWYDALLGPAGKVLAVVAGLVLLAFLFWLRRKKRQVSSLASVFDGKL